MKNSQEQEDPPSTLSVGEVARRSGVAVSALHFYESKGLISSSRTQGNQRRYARSVLRRVALIRVAQQVGIPLSDIEVALSKWPKSASLSRCDWTELSAAWREDLDQRINQLKKLRDTLDDCIGCGCLSIRGCRLRNPDDQLAVLGAGAHRLVVIKQQKE